LNFKLNRIKNIPLLEPACRKKPYNSQEEAQEMISHIRENRRVRELHLYKCPICGLWHLTSKSE
jgi:hypothetical protein